jgi:Tfp pilus assembly protein PilF
MITYCFISIVRQSLHRLAAALLLASGTAVCAAPHVPKDDAAVLERLPTRRSDPAMAELRELRAKLAAAQKDSAIAARLAQRYFDLASAEGDPRYVGYAEAALRPWSGDDSPVEILFTRGLLRQYRHDFAGALQDFERVLAREPRNQGARSWRAAIFMVQADYRAAARECAALAELASELIGTGCFAYLDATTGKTQGAYLRLAAALQRRPDAAPETRLWTLTRLAEMAWRLDDAPLAERRFREALKLGVNDNFLLAAYADFLLEQDRPKEVVALLQDWVRSDTLLLRLAIAEQRLKLPAAKSHTQALADRFAAAARRDERLHLAEEARFLLDLKADAPAALATALDNWKEQREPRDALIVLEAAAAAKDPKAAAPVLKWLDETRFESERMRRAAASLR